ncbi:MAG: flagellar biosynthetic protein FliO [Polyangiaceae bacterium]
MPPPSLSLSGVAPWLAGGLSPVASYLVETLVTLLAVIALAVLVLSAARRMGVGRQSGPLQLVGRLPLEGRRAVYLVKIGTKVVVIGASEAGLARLAELEEGELEFDVKEPAAFSDVLGRVLKAPPKKNIRVEKTPSDPVAAVLTPEPERAEDEA